MIIFNREGGNMQEFKEGGRYLIRESSYYQSDILEVKILEISEKAIKVDFGKKGVSWFLKDDFHYKILEELPNRLLLSVKQTIEDRSNEIQFDDDMWCEKDEPQFTLKMTEENDIEVKLKPNLEWEKNPLENLMTWDEAMEYVNSLANGWRLPTKKELEEAYKNKIYGFKPQNYWSSSIADLDTLNAWYVDFNDNGIGHYYYKRGRVFVRCVRDIPKETIRESFWEIRDLKEVQEKSALSDDYNLGLYNGMELCLSLLEKREPKYKDMEKPKLEWEQNPPSNLMTWGKANEYADTLGNGWRLPTKEELKKAYDNKIEGFKKTLAYWSSEEYAQNTIYAWNVNFNLGFVSSNFKAYNGFYVRCVREVK